MEYLISILTVTEFLASRVFLVMIKMLEKGRLYSLKKDGAKDSIYLNIKHEKFLFGSSEYCTVRIYIEGIFAEHCILTIEDRGKAYLEPLHPLALILVNGIKIKCKACLEDNDVITVFTKNFQFVYPSNSLSSSVSVERPLVLCYSKQNCETSHPVNDTRTPNIDYIPKILICMIENYFKKTPKCLLKILYHKPVNIPCEKINAHIANSSCADKLVTRYINRYGEESSELRRNLAFKLYQFFCLIRMLLNRNEEYIFDLLPIWKSVWKYNIARVKEDILFLPLKSLYLKYLYKQEITADQKFLQCRIDSCTPKSMSPVYDTMSEKNNHCMLKVCKSVNCNYQDNSKHDGQKQSQDSHRKSSVFYKKRVSLAVKRYHLRKRRSIMMSNSAGIGSDQNVELPDERQITNCESVINNPDEQDVMNLEEQKNVRTKRKRQCNKKEKEEFQDPGKENIADLIHNSSANQVTHPKSRKQKKIREKENSRSGGFQDEIKRKLTNDSPRKQNNSSESSEPKAKNGNKNKKKIALEKTNSCKSIQKYNTQEVFCSRIITRSMARKRH